jgi:hypothetical protein
MATAAEQQRFRAPIQREKEGRCYITVAFDPDAVWGFKERHHVSGTIEGRAWRGPLERNGKKFVMSLGAAWVRDNELDTKGALAVMLEPEGSQRSDLAPDITAALEASPDAARFFDALASFYRKGYLRWIDATKRSPQIRAERIAELIELLKAGHKEQPRRRRPTTRNHL